MSKYDLQILTPAWNELNEIATYHLQAVGTISASEITDKILCSLERLEEFPLSCAYAPYEELKLQEYRMLTCGKYVCFYRLLGNTVFVYHIVHGAREYSKLFK